MLNKTQVIPGKYYNVDYFDHQNHSYELDTTAEFHSVSSGLVVQGNKRDPNPWSYNIIDIVYPKGARVTSFTYPAFPELNHTVTESGTLNSSVSLTTAIDESLDTQAYNQALSRLYENIRGGLDLSVNAFQAKQNVRLISSTARLLSWAEKLPLVKRVSSAALAFQYGFRPIVSDIYGVANESLRYVLNRIQAYQGRAVAKSGEKFRVNDDFAFSLNGGDGIRTLNQKVGYTVRISCEVPDFDLARWTSLNPISIAWELLPYSFVVDWVFNVGDMLRSFESAILYGQSFKSGYVSRIAVYDIGYICNSSVPSQNTDPRVTQSGTINASSRSISFSRNLLSGCPFPRLPALKARLGSERLFNAAALLGNLLRR